jgi:hypothetical protein
VNVCPPVVDAEAPFHSKIPNLEFAVSNQYVPDSGLAAGAVALASNCPKLYLLLQHMLCWLHLNKNKPLVIRIHLFHHRV